MEIDSLIKKNYPELVEAELIREISAISTVKHVSQGTILMRPNQYIRELPLLIEGVIKISRSNELGEEIFLYHLEKGNSCAMSLTASLKEEQSMIKAVAIEKSSLLMIPIQNIDEWIMKYRSWKDFVLNTFSVRFEQLLKSYEDMAFHNLEERIIHYLRSKTNLLATKMLQMTHQEIADDLNTSREVISRLLKKLENDEVLTLSRGKIDLLI